MNGTLRTTAAVALAAASVAVALVATQRLDAQGISRQDGDTALRAYDYAELITRGPDGYFLTAERVVFMEGPEDVGGVEAENKRGVKIRRPISVIHLARLGREGWDVVERLDDNPDGERYLLRRAR